MSLRYGIIGGGMLGLTLALRLRQHGHSVTIFESATDLGGLASAWNLGAVTWDRHYHVMLLSDSRLRNLLDELGLTEDCEWVETKTGFFTDGQFYSMSNTVEFLKFPPLRFFDKLRLGGTIFLASRIKNWRRLEKIPVVDWLRKWSGRRTTEKIWLPLLRAKLGESYRDASAAFIWAIIARMYAARRSGLKKEMFGYVRGGYGRVLARFAAVLTEQGVRIEANRPVRSVHAGGIELTDGSKRGFERIIVTTAAPLASRLCPELTAVEQQRLNAIRYQGIVCASLLIRNSLGPYYVTNLTDTWVPFTAVIEMSALVKREEFGGNALVYLPKYVSPDDPIFRESDESIRHRFVSALERMYYHFRQEDVLAFRLSRVRHVFSISTLNYSQCVPAMETSVPGVYLVNSSQIVNGTLNINETIQLAEKSVQELESQADIGGSVGCLVENQ